MDKIATNIEVVGGCHEWQGALNSDGYPRVSRDGNTNIKLHRYVYESVKGEIPNGYVVRHSCDNPLCVNPEHLLVGTVQDNVADRVERGRTSGHVNEEEYKSVIELRAKGLLLKEIANTLGIKFKRVEYILNKAKLNAY